MRRPRRCARPSSSPGARSSSRWSASARSPTAAPSSPLTAGLFLPLAFAALSYPLASMLAVGAMVVGAYLAIALGMGGVEHARGLLHEPRARVRDVDVRLAGAQPRPPAPRARARVARRPADRVPEPPRLRGALRRRAQPRRAHRRDAVGRPPRPRRLQARQRRATGTPLGDELLRWVVDDDERRGAPVGRRRPPRRRRVRGPRPRRRRRRGRRCSPSACAPRWPSGRRSRFGVSTYPLDGVDRDGAAPARPTSRSTPSSTAAAPRRRGAGARELSWAAALARAVDVRMAGRPRALGRRRRRCAARIGAGLGWGADRARRACASPAMLHDVGKVAVPEAILRKPGPAHRRRDGASCARHADAGADIVARIEGLEAHRPVDPPLPRARRRLRLPGRPAPARTIPLESRHPARRRRLRRDDLRSRPTGAAMPVADALAELRRCAGRAVRRTRASSCCAQALACNGQARSTTSSASLTPRPRPRRRARSAASSRARSAAPRRSRVDGAPRREAVEHALGRLLGAADGEHDVERAGRVCPSLRTSSCVGGLVGLGPRGRRPARRRAGPARWSGCLQIALVRVAERSSRPPLPYQRKRTCARNEPGARQPLDALGEDEAAADAPRRGLLPDAELRAP